MTYLCLKLDLVEPAPEVLRQVVLTNSLDWAGWGMEAKLLALSFWVQEFWYKKRAPVCTKHFSCICGPRSGGGEHA